MVVKVGTGKSNPREAGAVDSLNDVSFPPDDHPGRAMIPSLRDRFVLNGPNGTYPCYMTAPAQSSVAAVIGSFKDALLNIEGHFQASRIFFEL